MKKWFLFHPALQLYYQMKKLNCTLQMNYYVDTSKASPVELLITPKQYLDAMKNLFEICIYPSMF